MIPAIGLLVGLAIGLILQPNVPLWLQPPCQACEARPRVATAIPFWNVAPKVGPHLCLYAASREALPGCNTAARP